MEGLLPLNQTAQLVTGDLASAEAHAFAGRCRSAILTKPFVFEELFGRLRGLVASAAVR